MSFATDNHAAIPATVNVLVPAELPASESSRTLTNTFTEVPSTLQVQLTSADASTIPTGTGRNVPRSADTDSSECDGKLDIPTDGNLAWALQRLVLKDQTNNITVKAQKKPRVPNEIIYLIGERTAHRCDLRELALCCKSWSPIVTPYLYRRIHLRTVFQACALATTLIEHPERRDYIHFLSVSLDKRSTPNFQQVLLELIIKCRKLQALRLDTNPLLNSNQRPGDMLINFDIPSSDEWLSAVLGAHGSWVRHLDVIDYQYRCPYLSFGLVSPM